MSYIDCRLDQPPSPVLQSSQALSIRYKRCFFFTGPFVPALITTRIYTLINQRIRLGSIIVLAVQDRGDLSRQALSYLLDHVGLNECFQCWRDWLVRINLPSLLVTMQP